MHALSLGKINPPVRYYPILSHLIPARDGCHFGVAVVRVTCVRVYRFFVRSFVRSLDKDTIVGFHALHDLRRHAVPRCWALHKQTQMGGALSYGFVRSFVNFERKI